MLGSVSMLGMVEDIIKQIFHLKKYRNIETDHIIGHNSHWVSHLCEIVVSGYLIGFCASKFLMYGVFLAGISLSLFLSFSVCV